VGDFTFEWREAVRMISKGEHLTKEGFLTIMAPKRRLEQGRIGNRGGRGGKWESFLQSTLLGHQPQYRRDIERQVSKCIIFFKKKLN
jgi:hypothetical protein